MLPDLQYREAPNRKNRRNPLRFRFSSRSRIYEVRSYSLLLSLYCLLFLAHGTFSPARMFDPMERSVLPEYYNTVRKDFYNRFRLIARDGNPTGRVETRVSIDPRDLGHDADASVDVFYNASPIFPVIPA